MLTVVSCSSLMVGCGCSRSTPKPVPVPVPVIPHLAGSITTTKDVNPDVTGRPSPVVVRLYYLRSSDAFQGADFFQLYDDEAAVLANDLVTREEFSIRPESSVSFERKLDDGTRYIGVAAAFQDLEDAQWRALTELPEKTETTLHIEVQRLGIVIRDQ